MYELNDKRFKANSGDNRHFRNQCESEPKANPARPEPRNNEQCCGRGEKKHQATSIVAFMMVVQSNDLFILGPASHSFAIMPLDQ